MAIAPINYATIQRTADIETFKNQQDTKPMVDQQNIQVQVDHREDVLHHQVIHPEENEQLDNHTDAREEGKNKYKKQGSVRKKTNKETKRTSDDDQHDFGMREVF